MRLQSLPTFSALSAFALCATLSLTSFKASETTATTTPTEEAYVTFTNIKLTVGDRVMPGNDSKVSAELGKSSQVGMVAQGDNAVSATFRFRRYTSGRSETKQGAIKAEIKYVVTVDGKTSTKTIERNWFAETSRVIEEKVTFSFADKKSFSNKTAVLTYSATLPE